MSRFGVVVGAVLSTGCATIVSDDEYAVAFTSSPTGAQVRIIDEAEVLVHQGTTPFTTTLWADDGYYDCMDYIAEFRLNGHEPAQMVVDANFDEWVYGNILFGGLIGVLIVDPLSGSVCELPRLIHVLLAPMDPSSQAPEEEVAPPPSPPVAPQP